MKVLLIYPPHERMITTNAPELVDQESGVYPPLGLLYVAAYAEAHTDHEIAVLDSVAAGISNPGVERAIEAERPDVVGIQTQTFTLVDALETAQAVKRASPDTHVCLGGPHVNLYPTETVRMPEVDSLVLGEGEMTFCDLLEALASEKDLGSVAGVVSKRGEEVVANPPRPLIEDLDALPFPARHLTPIQKYRSVLARRSPITTMMASRGCPFKCLYCSRPHLGKRHRPRSPGNVVDEMERCVEMGIREFFFYDDLFAPAKDRMYAMADEILRRGLEVGWDVRARVDSVDRDVLRKLRQAGCERIHYGVEAGTPEILKVLRKGIQLERVREAFKATKEAGITTLAYFMIGSPTETREQVLRTIEFATSLDADFAQISIATPFPGTDLYRLGLEQGRFSSDYWRDYASNPREDFVPELWEDVLSRQELVSLLKLAYRRFYYRPRHVLREVLKVRSAGEFFRKTKAGLKAFTTLSPKA